MEHYLFAKTNRMTLHKVLGEVWYACKLFIDEVCFAKSGCSLQGPIHFEIQIFNNNNSRNINNNNNVFCNISLTAEVFATRLSRCKGTKFEEHR